CVHTDLLAAGLIEDPFLDDNENRLTWIGRSGWDYETVFTWHDDSHERTDLVCEGLDTVATIELNGVAIATTANQHRSYRFSVRELLHEGENTLRVRFASPLAYAEARRAELGDRPGSYPAPYQFIRKMACNFGWDWGPALVTSGIWRPIGLHSWSGARLASVRPLVCTDGPDGRVEVHVTLERTGDAPLTLTAQVAGVVVETVLAAGEREAVLALRVPAPRLWWPRGYGAQDRYDLTVHLSEHTGEPGKAGETGESGATLEEWTGRVGFRDVRLDRT
ncbi:glycosyl hydrolase 2 galactose-binding domain-containing protein, partial [Streptosporangium sp. G11]|uniref:glycosyl hydrolase 2 galactose-binding domain-containing protein n=1 Tax=Streptosporangium sp. G11 TaxID=3436926 RepID=UPI003EB7FBD4